MNKQQLAVGDRRLQRLIENLGSAFAEVSYDALDGTLITIKRFDCNEPTTFNPDAPIKSGGEYRYPRLVERRIASIVEAHRLGLLLHAVEGVN